MKTTLIVCGVLWIGGALLGLHLLVDIFGSITILLGGFMLGRWGWRKLRERETAGEQGANAKPEVAFATVTRTETYPQSSITPKIDPALQAALDAVNVAVQRELSSPTRANTKATKAAEAHYEAVCAAMLEGITRELGNKANP